MFMKDHKELELKVIEKLSPYLNKEEVEFLRYETRSI